MPSGLTPYLGTKIGADAVDNILGILAASMLTVTTFSLSIMVNAYSAATTNVTPRATSLLIEDSTTQTVLATFIGSFLFSLVGIVTLSAGAYGEEGRVLLFVVTLLVIALIILTLIRWIGHISRLGRVGDTIDRVEDAVLSAIQEICPLTGLRAGSPSPVPADARFLHLEEVGYLAHMDITRLRQIASETTARINVMVLPGAFLEPARPVVWLVEPLNVDVEASIRSCFTINLRRSFDQDPRFGLSVLAEIASRALSPSINDAGTALDVLSRAIRLFQAATGPERAEVPGDNYLTLPELDLDDLFDDLFTPIARDGASIVEIHIRLQKILASLQRMDRRLDEPARRHSLLAFKRAEASLLIDEDKQQLRRLTLSMQNPVEGWRNV